MDDPTDPLSTLWQKYPVPPLTGCRRGHNAIQQCQLQKSYKVLQKLGFIHVKYENDKVLCTSPGNEGRRDCLNCIGLSGIGGATSYMNVHIQRLYKGHHAAINADLQESWHIISAKFFDKFVFLKHLVPNQTND